MDHTILPHDHHTSESSQRLMETMPTVEAISLVSEALKQLGDPSRLRIFWLLCHTEECVTDIAGYMQMSSPAVSHHLRLLKAAGLVSSQRNGKEMFYKAADSELVNELHLIIERIAEITCPTEEV